MIREYETTFATNLIAKRFDEGHPWRPDWYVAVSDAPHNPEYYQYFCRGVLGARQGSIVSEENWDLLGDLSTLALSVRVFSEGKPEWVRSIESSTDEGSFDDGYEYCKYAMSHLVTFQAAVLMGFDTLFLIGFDGNFRPQLEDGTDVCHFTENYWSDFQQNRPKDEEFWTRMNHGHMVAHSFVRSMEEEHNFKVINCTPDSVYKMYDYMPFKEALRA